MQFSSLFICAALSGAACFAQGQGHRAMSPLNQTLTGTWVALGRRAAPPGTPIPPPAPLVFVFHNDGTLTGSGAGNASGFNGVWIRVADRKFLITYLVLTYDATGAVTGISKIRLTTQIDSDGSALRGSQEVLVVDPAGNVQFTALGGSHSMVRLAPEKTADFDSFLANQ
jgi:poly(3-hydroxybutyrate) depolymerase